MKPNESDVYTVSDEAAPFRSGWALEGSRIDALEREKKSFAKWIAELTSELSTKEKLIQSQSLDIEKHRQESQEKGLAIQQYRELLELTKQIGDRRLRVVFWLYNLVALAILTLAFVAR